MNLRKAVLTAGLLTAAIPLSTWTADAALPVNQISLWNLSPDGMGCVLTTEECSVTVIGLTDVTTPVTISVGNTVLGTPPIHTYTISDGGVMYTPGETQSLSWFPLQAGTYTLTATQGTAKFTKTVTIQDYNSLPGLVKRITGMSSAS
ncbi:hypothetical protein ACWELJ_28355 [Nocardia sp. NPDC004582]